ncbi:hypothetical protein B0J17DRAFT_721171 [Rhizoctonia solani]|nr:hypothetical protein B0J17DRAFT_721171 [Rhizoctonia solani]
MTLPQTLQKGAPPSFPQGSNQNGAKDTDIIEHDSGVGRSLIGFLHPPSQCFVFTNGYSTHSEHEDDNIRDMVLEPGPIDIDISRLSQWTGRFNPKPNFRSYCDREALLAHRILDHKPLNESHPDLLAFAPADYLDVLPSGEPKLIPYATMRESLLKPPDQDHYSSSLRSVFVTTFFLPYMLEYDGSDVQWKETEYQGTFSGTSSEIVHIAATTPGESAFRLLLGLSSLKRCTVSTQPKVIAEANRKTATGKCQHDLARGPLPAPKIYCSSKIDGPHFFAALVSVHRTSAWGSIPI